MSPSPPADAARVRKALESRGARVLDDVRTMLCRFVAFPSEHAEVAVVGWVVHTHAVAVLDSTPRLVFQSPEPGSGKSRALEVLGHLARDPVHVANASAAFLARRIHASETPPTVLFDEYDATFGTHSRSESAEDLRGILNSGHRRGATYARAAVRGKEVVTEEFATFAPVALAGLGTLPDTIRTRSIEVRMRRRRPDEIVEPFRERTNGPALHALRDRVAGWADRIAPKIGEPWPDLPEGITDRDADVWEGLIAIADLAGGDWPTLMRDAAVAMVAESKVLPPSHGIRLLGDVRRIFAARGVDRLRAVELIDALCNLDDAPWGDLGGRGPIDGRYVGKVIREYDVPAAHTIRFDNSTAKGWHRVDFADAWARYLPEPKTAGTTIPLDPKETP